MPVNTQSVNQQQRMNYAPADLNPEKDLPAGFLEFLRPLHQRFTPWQQQVIARRAEVLKASHSGHPPDYLPPSEATTKDWRIEVPDWCADQRNQMTGPADDGELTVKLLNSGSPAVMIDIEDSTANTWDHIMLAIQNTIAAYQYELSYSDKKRHKQVTVQRSKTVTWVRPRGLHVSQGGIFKNEIMSASLFDLALIWYQIDPASLPHNFCVYIPKSESAEEALWWRDLFQAFAKLKGLPHDYIKCMALVEAHPLAYQMEEFLFNLRDHCLGLNLGRWDYMASLIDFMIEDPNWILPDRNTIPHDVAFFQNFRTSDAGNLPQARSSRHRRNDRALSQPHRCRVERARSQGSRAGQEERGQLPDGWRMDRPSRSESKSRSRNSLIPIRFPSGLTCRMRIPTCGPFPRALALPLSPERVRRFAP